MSTTGTNFQPSAALLARRHAGMWQLIARALSAQQISDNARAAVQRLDEQVKQFTACHAVGNLPAVLIEATPQLIADFGGVAVHLGNDKFAFFSAQGNECGAAIDGNNCGDGHVGALQFSDIQG